MDEQTKDFWRWRDTILLNEDYVLELLCFDLTTESPYNLIFDFLKKYDVASNKLLRDTSWGFINDTNLTHMCLLFSSRTIAAAALYCGARRAGVEFPDDAQGCPWWETQGVKGIEMRRAYNHMVSLFENQTIRSDHDHYVGACTPLEVDERFAKTRLRREQAPGTPEPVDVEAYEKRRVTEENGRVEAPPPKLKSRVPTAALESRPAKRFRPDKPEPAKNRATKKGDDSGSEEGEVDG